MADAFASGGVPQPPAKKCKLTRVSSEWRDVHPTTEEAHPSSVANLIIPRVLVPIKKALTATIKVSDNFDEHEFKVAIAYTTYAEWRRTNSLQFRRMQTRNETKGHRTTERVRRYFPRSEYELQRVDWKF